MLRRRLCFAYGVTWPKGANAVELGSCFVRLAIGVLGTRCYVLVGRSHAVHAGPCLRSLLQQVSLGRCLEWRGVSQCLREHRQHRSTLQAGRQNPRCDGVVIT